MRKLFSLILLVYMTVVPITSYSQEAVHIPQQVKIQFMEDFISATNVKWSAGDVHGVFVADFTHQGHHKSVAYQSDSKRLYIRTHVSKSVVPAKILDALDKSCYDTCVLDDIVKAETPGEIVYCFRVYSDGTYSELEFPGSSVN